MEVSGQLYIPAANNSWHPLDGRLGGEEKNLVLLRESNPDSPVLQSSVVAVLTELSGMLKGWACSWNGGGETGSRPGLHTELSLQNLLENVQLENQE
jgi:hypothetical protein